MSEGENMNSGEVTTNSAVFEQIRRIGLDGEEYWSARDLAKVLQYSEYRHFLPVIERAKQACQNSGHPVENHFEDILDMVDIGSGTQSSGGEVKHGRR